MKVNQKLRNLNTSFYLTKGELTECIVQSTACWYVYKDHYAWKRNHYCALCHLTDDILYKRLGQRITPFDSSVCPCSLCFLTYNDLSICTTAINKCDKEDFYMIRDNVLKLSTELSYKLNENDELFNNYINFIKKQAIYFFKLND